MCGMNYVWQMYSVDDAKDKKHIQLEYDEIKIAKKVLSLGKHAGKI